MQEKALKRSQTMYIMEATLEYFISLLVAGSYLATLTKELGFSDSLTGILSSVISLGCLFQLLSLSIRRTRVKKMVLICSIMNQILFMLLYVIPLTGLGRQVKIASFVVLIFTAYLIFNLVHPQKVNWLMSLVEDERRGRFTADKEIFSLITGMVFSFGMGAMIDHFTEMGQIRLSFVASAIVIFVLMIFHSITMLLAVEKEMLRGTCGSLSQNIQELLQNKSILKVMLILVLYNISTYVSTPFYGTYQISELGLSLKYVSVMVICGSIARIMVSRFWGRYADKNSFAKMFEKCMIFLGIAQLCVVFATPYNGRITFALYYIFQGIAFGGINSSLVNLVFDYVPAEKKADSLAITQAVAGLVGFLTTLFISPVVTSIQRQGNQVFGIPIYAQQFVSIIAFVFLAAAFVYTRYFLEKKVR